MNKLNDDSTPGKSSTVSTEVGQITNEDMGSQVLNKSTTGVGEPNKSYHQTESDREWEVISHKIRSTSNKNNFEKVLKQDKHNSTIPTRKRVGGLYRNRPTVRVLTTNKSITTTKELMKNRGGYMTKDKQTKFTQLKVEFNLLNTTDVFNIILAVETLFKTFVQVDPTIRVYNHANTLLLWEENSILCKDDEFVKYFKMREQTFRKGNKKVTIYFGVESNYNINSINFQDPVKSFLLNNNIWIKPGLYSTKTVSSPGFFTMVFCSDRDTSNGRKRSLDRAAKRTR